MYKFLLLTMVASTLIACDRQDKPNHSYVNEPGAVNNPNVDLSKQSSNAPHTLTDALAEEKETKEDRLLTQKIRQDIVMDDTLSTLGKNITIITVNGIVTLRGPVQGPKEKEVILKKVKSVEGVVRIDDQMENISSK